MATMLSANGIGAHPTTIAKIEKGDRQVSITEAAGVADLFGVSVDDLLGRNTPAESDFGQALGRLRNAAEKTAWGLAEAMQGVRTCASDVAAFEFEGRGDLGHALSAAFTAVEQAIDAVGEISTFKLAPKASVRLRGDDELHSFAHSGEAITAMRRKLTEKKGRTR